MITTHSDENGHAAVLNLQLGVLRGKLLQHGVVQVVECVHRNGQDHDERPAKRHREKVPVDDATAAGAGLRGPQVRGASARGRVLALGYQPFHLVQSLAKHLHRFGREVLWSKMKEF